MTKKKTDEVLEETKENAAVKTEEEKQAEYWNEKVALTVPTDMTNPNNNEITITVNGKTFQIMRNEEVMVPRYVAQVYKDGINQYNDTIKKSLRKQSEYIDKNK